MAGHDHTQVVHDHADSWHHHGAAEGVPQHEHASVANAGALIRWFFLLSVTFIVTVVALAMYFAKFSAQIRQERVEILMTKDADGARANAEVRLGTSDRPFEYQPADKAAHTVQIPIDEAMKRVVDQYSKKNASK